MDKMVNLRNALLKAGLVTDKDVKRIEEVKKSETKPKPETQENNSTK